MHDIIVVSTEIKFRPLYVCSSCGVAVHGEVVTAKFLTGMTVTPEELLKRWPLTVRHAPVGWSSYYGKEADIFKCPECV